MFENYNLPWWFKLIIWLVKLPIRIIAWIARGFVHLVEGATGGGLGGSGGL